MMVTRLPDGELVDDDDTPAPTYPRQPGTSVYGA
jgi:hypothetical protein